jgi:signal transduction histidine kinase
MGQSSAGSHDSAPSGDPAARHTQGPSPMLTSLRYPRSVWSSSTTALVTAAVLTPLVGTLLVAQELRTLSGAATTTQLVVFPTVLGAATVLYVQYRLTASNVLAWAALCLSLYAVQDGMLAGLRAGEPGEFFKRPGWVMIVDLPVAVLVLVAMRLSSRVRLPVDPLATGMALGLLVAAVNLAANSWGAELSMTSPPVLVAELLMLVVAVAIGQTAYQLDEIPRWCSGRLALGTVALVANRIASAQDTGGVVVEVFAVVTGVTGAVLMLSAAASSLRFEIQEQRSSLTLLEEQVAAMEADERDSRARLHEITNSIASIAVASSLIHQHDDVPSPKRQKLVQMLESESGRLARTLTGADGAPDPAAAEEPTPVNGSAPASLQMVDLDQVIGPLVTSQQTLRHAVDWEPSGYQAIGDADAVAEVVSILLDNAARHAPDARTSIEVRRRGDNVEIAVCDDGPGVAPEVRRKLFQWGGRGPDSRGQGIGLHLAYRLMTSGGNSLRLEANRAGTAFVIGLPAARTRS